MSTPNPQTPTFRGLSIRRSAPLSWVANFAADSKLGLLIIPVCALIVIGKQMSLLLGLSDLDRLAQTALPYVLAIFIIAAAIPFVPGAEIGFGLLMLFGAEIAIAVYFSMLAALLLAFLVGQLVSPQFLASKFPRLYARWRLIRLLLRKTTHGKSKNYSFVTFHFMAANKYLILSAALNTPGNSVLGGGGGLAFLAGASRKFSLLEFLLTVALAASPVPAFFLLFG